MNFLSRFVPVIKKNGILFHNKLMAGNMKQFDRERKGNIQL